MRLNETELQTLESLIAMGQRASAPTKLDAVDDIAAASNRMQDLKDAARDLGRNDAAADKGGDKSADAGDKGAGDRDGDGRDDGGVLEDLIEAEKRDALFAEGDRTSQSVDNLMNARLRRLAKNK